MGSASFITPSRLVPAALAAAAGLAATSAARADIARASFADTSGLNIVLNSSTADGALRLTGTAGNQVGGAWEDTKQHVAGGFTTTFSFRISETGGACDASQQPGGDGFAFLIQNYANMGPELVGPMTGGGLGFNGMSNALAIEFDTWKNDRAQDLDANHVSILTNGTGVLTPEHTYSLGYSSAIPNMSDGNVHAVKVEYTPGTMKLYLDNMATPVLSVAVNLATSLSLDSGRAWVGFTSATGGAWENHDILNWSMSSVPSPGSAALLGAGVVMAAVRRRR